MSFMRLPSITLLFAVAACLSVAPAAAHAQAAPQSPAEAAAVPPSTLVQAALSGVQNTTSGLNIRRWRTSRDARKVAQQNVDSIQSDLGAQLPQLLTQADHTPNSVPRSFALYRNIDALYDVLLRVSRTADTAAPANEANAIAASLEQLEQARKALGDQILRVSEENQTRLEALQRAAAQSAAEAAAAPPMHESIVTDGPVRTSRREVRHHHTIRRAAKKPSPDVPATPKA